ncbi:MAG TPA: TIGR02266 family protein [Polyangiaceae bacterium]
MSNAARIHEPSPALDSSPHAESAGARVREHLRYKVDLDVSLGSDHNFYSGFAENLSVGGVFIATHLLRPVGERVEICIHLPDGSEIRAHGEVRWVRVFNADSDTPPGIGVRFSELEPGSERAIERFLHEREPIFFDDE